MSRWRINYFAAIITFINIDYKTVILYEDMRIDAYASSYKILLIDLV